VGTILRHSVEITYTAKTPPQTSTQNTSKDAVLRKTVPFRGRKTIL